MHLKNGSRCVGTNLTVLGLIAVASISGNIASAETIFTVNGVAIDSAVVDIYFESR